MDPRYSDNHLSKMIKNSLDDILKLIQSVLIHDDAMQLESNHSHSLLKFIEKTISEMKTMKDVEHFFENIDQITFLMNQMPEQILIQLNQLKKQVQMNQADWVETNTFGEFIDNDQEINLGEMNSELTRIELLERHGMHCKSVARDSDHEYESQSDSESHDTIATTDAVRGSSSETSDEENVTSRIFNLNHSINHSPFHFPPSSLQLPQKRERDNEPTSHVEKKLKTR